MEKQTIEMSDFKIKFPEYKKLKVNVEAIESVQDLASVIFILLGGDVIKININDVPDDKKTILEKYFIEV